MQLHMRPIRLPAKTIRYTHTFGLGGMSLVLVLMLMLTGVLMMFVYEPSPERAYDSVVSMQQEVLFGRLVRGSLGLLSVAQTDIGAVAQPVAHDHRGRGPR